MRAPTRYIVNTINPYITQNDVLSMGTNPVLKLVMSAEIILEQARVCVCACVYVCVCARVRAIVSSLFVVVVCEHSSLWWGYANHTDTHTTHQRDPLQ